MSQTRDLRRLLFAWLSVAVGVLLPMAGFAAISTTAFASVEVAALDLPDLGDVFAGVAAFADFPMLALALGATLACLISWRLGRYGVERTPATEAPNQLLIKALNHIDLCVVIYDRDLRAVHWNNATACTFPYLLAELKKGATLMDLFEVSHGAERLRKTRKPDEATEFARSIVTELRAGREVTRVVEMADGRVFEAVEFAFGPDHFASVRKDVTRLQQQADQIRDQNVRLSIVNERMQHFAEMAAHDLRAPLLHQATLMNFIAEDLQDANVDVPAEIEEYLDLSRTSLCRMQQLVEDLLEYARCNATTQETDPVSLAERLDTIMDLVALPDGFNVTWSDELPCLQIPEAACDIVLRNLITNAIKHHDRDEGNITITSRLVSHTALISVTDDGPGIPKDDQAKIFEPFQQLSTNNQRRGSGLGLAMVARTVASWNGDISVESVSQRGSTFRFSAPLATRNTRSIDLAAPDQRPTGTG